MPHNFQLSHHLLTGLNSYTKPDAFEGFAWITPTLFPRIVLLSVLLAFFSQALKNFSSSRHLEVLFNHKAESLRTFDKFVEHAKDDQIKDAILVEAARTIFNLNDTGLSGSGHADQPPGTLGGIALVQSFFTRQGKD